MDNQKFGKFIKEQRQKVGLTQKNLGEKLGVTDKAVSKWERGLSFPDITIINPLAGVFGISTSELLNAEVGVKEEIDVEQVVKDAIEQYKNVSAKRQKNLKKIRITLGIISLLTFVFSSIIQLAYIFVFKPKMYEYVIDSILYVVNQIIIVSGFFMAILLFKNGKIKNVVAVTMLVLTTVVNIAIMSNNTQKRACIVDFSNNMKSQLVLKIDENSGKIDYYRDCKFLLWAKKNNSLEHATRGEVSYYWIEDDICVLRYKDNDKFLRAFVATYGTRAEPKNVAYYYVINAISGNWQSENNNKIFVGNGKIRVKFDDNNEIFDFSECKQYGDSALILYKGDVPMYAIGLNKNCKVASGSNIVKDGGTITILNIVNKSALPEEFVCTTYKNDNNLDDYNKLHLRKNEYKIIDKKLYISYDGERTVEVPGIYEVQSISEEEHQIAEYKTFFYYDDRGKRFFVYSDDMGKTWDKVELEARPRIKDIKFPSADVGYMLVFDDVASGVAVGRILKTENGGKTWLDVFYGIERNSERLFGIGSKIIFVNENIGFVTFETASQDYCDLYITKDGARTFEQVKIPIDDVITNEKYSKYDFYALPYKDMDDIWRFKVSQGNDSEEWAETRLYEFDKDFNVRASN